MYFGKVIAGAALAAALIGFAGAGQAAPISTTLPALAPSSSQAIEQVRHRRVCDRVCTKRIFGKCVRRVTRCYRPRHRGRW
jgi:hypothetical protein